MFSSLDRNDELKSALKDYIERKLQSYGLPAYAYTVISKKNPLQIMVVSSYSDEWVQLYIENSFQKIDPVVLTAIKAISPFCWDDNISFMTDLKAAKIFKLAKNYNIVNGFTFVVHDHMNNVALLSLIIDKSECKNIEDFIQKSIAQLQMMLIDIHEQMYKLIFSKTNENLQLKISSIFTPQEEVVLHWASMGKTYEEIAVIIGITRRTVKFHMGNVVKKMGVSNARQAIRLGVELGVITPSYR